MSPIADTSEDALLDGAVALRQPRRGFRVAIDTVLLAAAVPALGGDTVFEPGAGCGAAALCLARRTGCRVIGVETQAELVALAADNARRNGLEARVSVLAGSIGDPLPAAAGPFDHAMANPPYLAPGRGTRPPDEARAAAHVEGEADLKRWIAAMLSALKPKGMLTLVHRADRLDAILAALDGKAGGIVVFPLWPRIGTPARRIIVRARKGRRTPLSLASGLVLHQPDGRYTAEADAILRGAALDF
jgi:tRNA1(Val) A37 N6-methylase TrmN6